MNCSKYEKLTRTNPKKIFIIIIKKITIQYIRYIFTIESIQKPIIDRH